MRGIPNKFLLLHQLWEQVNHLRFLIIGLNTLEMLKVRRHQ